MSINKRIAFGAAAIGFSRAVNILLGLALMPVLFRHLPKEELGVWLLLAQSWAAMGILDLGFGVTLTRRIALARGRSGEAPDSTLTPGTLREIADLTACGQRIYRLMAGGVFVVSWTLGLLYLRNLELQAVSHNAVWMAWTVLCICQALGVWSSVWTCLLQGIGSVGWDALINSFVSTVILVSQIVVVLCGGGLVALSVIAALGALGQRALTRRVARRHRPELFALHGQWNPDVLHGMAGLAFRAWLTALGYVLVANSDQLFIASSEGAASIPAYRAALLLVIHLHFLSGVFSGASTVFVSHLWQADRLSEIRAILRRNVLIGLLSMGCGSAVILALGPALFDLWLAPGNFVGYPIIAIFLANFALEHHANVFSTCGRATDDEAYALPSMLAGVLKLATAAVFMRHWGLVGLAASTLVAQAATTCWYSVYRASLRLGIRLQDHLYRVLLPCVIAFLVSLAVCHAASRSLAGQTLVLQVAAVSLVGGALLSAACWFLVLRTDQRARLLARIKLPG